MATNGFPVEFLSLTGAKGAQLRATVSSFGPLLLSKVLGLNATQSSVMSLVFKYCDDKGLLLLDFPDLRAVLQYLTGDGAEELKTYGGNVQGDGGCAAPGNGGAGATGRRDNFSVSRSSTSMTCIQVERDGRGLISVLELV